MKAVEKHIPFDSIPRLGAAAGIDLYLICHDHDKIISLQDQIVRDIEEGHIDKKSIECSVKKILDFKKQIPDSSCGKKNLITLAREHLELIREMESHLP